MSTGGGFMIREWAIATEGQSLGGVPLPTESEAWRVYNISNVSR